MHPYSFSRPRFLACLLLGLLLLPAASSAAGRGIGLGATLGEPTGATLALWVDQDEAWIVGLGVNPGDDNSVQESVDYVLYLFDIGRTVMPGFAPYAGLGARVNGPSDGHTEFGIRFVAGAAWFPEQYNMELFAELVPILDVSPNWEIDLNAVVGLRLYGW
jgi:hypothetical protein